MKFNKIIAIISTSNTKEVMKMEQELIELAKKKAVLITVSEIIWVGADQNNGEPILLPKGTRLNVIGILPGDGGRLLMQIADYLDSGRRQFYNRQRIPEFKAGLWSTSCFEVCDHLRD